MFRNTSIVITGGASGIGFALAKRFAALGNSVIICGRRSERLREAASVISGAVTFQCDISQEDERLRLQQFVASTHPEVSVLINNAGVQMRPGAVTEPQDWNAHRKEIATNLEAPIHLSILFADHLKSKNQAAIVNVSSGLAFVPMSFMATYCASKAALHSFTLSLRHQLRKTSIKVIEVIPPKVNTDLGGVGLHADGVPIDEYAESVMQSLLNGSLEIGYGTSERNRLASRSELDQLFLSLNPD